MDNLTRLQNSRKAYKSHVTRTYNEVDELMALDSINLQLSSLKTFHETLKTKREKIQQLDSQILEGIEDPTLLEEAILD